MGGHCTGKSKRLMLTVGIIGYGAIGKALYQAIADKQAGAVRCAAVLVRSPRSGGQAANVITADADYFLRQSFDTVIECAGHEAVRSLGERVLQRADFMVTSVGAFTDDALFGRLRAAARQSGRRLILPAAGIGALDTLAAAATAPLEKVTITVRKNIAAWYGTPAEAVCDLDALREAATVYEGPVREGARLYPANVNISAAVALAGIGLDKTVLRIIADPAISTHIVEVEAVGAFGRFYFMEDVMPSPENPKTGTIVAMALIKTLRQLSSELLIGA